MNRLPIYSRQSMLLVAFVATAFAAGCGGGGSSTPLARGGGGGNDNTAPTVVSTSPADAAADVCINRSVHATFSEAMDVATLTDASFTLTDAQAAPVAGTVSYDEDNNIATFNPTADLAANETYTATVVGGDSGAKDSAGNAVAADEVWTFTTGTCTAAEPVALGTASTFGAGSGVGIDNTGTLTVVEGDLGAATPSAAITGLRDAVSPPFTVTAENNGEVTGTIYTNEDPVADGGVTAGEVGPALAAAYDEMATAPGGTDPGAELGGQTLDPGVYTTAASATITGGDLTLDAGGDPDAVWVFQIPGALTVGDTEARSVLLVNGARAQNVFWAVGTTATINAVGGGTMVGTIIAPDGIAISTSGNTEITTLEGRVFGFPGLVTMTNTVINVPAATVAPAPAPDPDPAP